MKRRIAFAVLILMAVFGISVWILDLCSIIAVPRQVVVVACQAGIIAVMFIVLAIAKIRF